MACGIATRSKGSSQLDMRPLAWRAPMVSFGADGPDLEPLLRCMEESTKNTCVFRDFVTPANEAHVITNAIAWRNKPASHATIAASQNAVLELGYTSMCTPKRALELNLGGHDHRHMIPEAARAARFPLHMREHLGYWRSLPPASGDDAESLTAIARAVSAAREKKKRSHAFAFQSDRYSSADGATVASDATRITIARLIASALAKWRADGKHAPATRAEQLQTISESVSGANIAQQ